MRIFIAVWSRAFGVPEMKTDTSLGIDIIGKQLILSFEGQTGSTGRSLGFVGPSGGSVAAPSGTAGLVVENRWDQTLG